MICNPEGDSKWKSARKEPEDCIYSSLRKFAVRWREGGREKEQVLLTRLTSKFMVHLQAWRQGFGGLSYGIVESGKFVHWREQPDLGLMIQGSGTCCFVGTDVCSISSHFCQLQLQDCWSIRITQPGSRT